MKLMSKELLRQADIHLNSRKLPISHWNQIFSAYFSSWSCADLSERSASKRKHPWRRPKCEGSLWKCERVSAYAEICPAENDDERKNLLGIDVLPIVRDRKSIEPGAKKLGDSSSRGRYIQIAMLSNADRWFTTVNKRNFKWRIMFLFVFFCPLCRREIHGCLRNHTSRCRCATQTHLRIVCWFRTQKSILFARNADSMWVVWHKSAGAAGANGKRGCDEYLISLNRF